MPTDKTADKIRGLLIPDPRFKFSAFSESDSTFTQDGRRVGVPEAQQNSEAVHETSGDIIANEDLKIYTQSPGFPGADSGTFLWYKTDNTAALKYQGYEPPKTITGVETVEPYNQGDPDYYAVPDIITADDDSMIIAAVKDRSSPDSGAPLRIWRKPATGAASWTATDVEDDSVLEPGIQIESAKWPHCGPALVKLPNGRILLFFWINLGRTIAGAGPDNRQTWQIRALYSDDHGQNWNIYKEYCLIDPLVPLSYNDTSAAGGRYLPGRLRAAYAGGQIVLFSSMIDTSTVTTSGQPNGGRPIFGQWASSDDGASFVTVEISLRSNTAKTAIDVVGYQNGFVVFYAKGSYGSDMSTAALGSAFEKLSASTERAIDILYNACAFPRAPIGTEDYWNHFDTALTAAPDGNLYLIFNYNTDSGWTEQAHNTVMIYSTDGGATWSLSGARYDDNTSDLRREGDGTVYRSTIGEYDPVIENTATHIRERIGDFAMTWQRGRAVVACKYRLTNPSAQTGYQIAGLQSGLLQEPIWALYLGGYTNVTIGSCLGTVQMRQRGNWCKSYMPFVEPNDMGSDTENHNWTETTTGASSATISYGFNPYLKVVGGDGAGNTGQRYFSGVTDFNDGVSPSTINSGSRTFVEFAVDAVSGGSKFGEGIALRIRNGNATYAEYVSLRLEQTGTTVNLHIFDIQGAATFITTIDLNASGIKDFPEFRVLVYGQRIVVYGRKYDADAEYREFIKLYESATQELAIGTAGGGRCSVEWGAISVGGDVTANESRWYKLATGSDDSDEVPCAVPKINDWLDYSAPRHVGGREYSVFPLYLKEGLRFRTVDGPSSKAEEWRIRPRYDYPIDVVNTDVSASPRRTWRSVGDGVQQILSWTLDDNEPAYFLGSTIGLYLGNINFRFFNVEGYDGAAWQTLANVDNAQPVKYLREGNTIKPDVPNTTSGTTSPHFYTYNSLSGSTFDFDGAGQTPKPHLITANSEGVFSAQTTKQPALIVAGDVSTYGASGTGAIWAKNVAVLIHGAESIKYEKIRIVIPSSVGGVSNLTAAGYYEIGTALFGHLAGFGRQYSFGHTRELETNVQVETSAGGYRTATKLGPARRRVSLSWKDPIDLSQMMGTDPAPDYVKSSNVAGKGVVASIADTPFLVQGLIDGIDGAKTPVVFLPAIATASAQTTVILNPGEMLYGRITSRRQQIENEFGEEWAGDNLGEVATATTIRIEEEL